EELAAPGLVSRSSGRPGHTAPAPEHATGTAHREGSGGRCDDGQVTEHAASAAVTAEDEVATLCRDLIRIDTSNYGDHSGPGERKAAEYVAEKLAEVGLEPQIFESHKGRASTVARIEGEDPSRPALLIHGHTDVVPAN